MNKISLLFLLTASLLLNGCDSAQLKSKYSQNANMLNIYSYILDSKSKIADLYNTSIEIFLLKFSKKHKNDDMLNSSFEHLLQNHREIILRFPRTSWAYQ